ncbi:MAG: glucose-6-phosphate isomerase, partial [Gammaproteobacteria bacterium]
MQQLPAWQALQQHFAQLTGLHMRDLFDRDPQRFARFSLTFEDILFDYSKNRITDETLSLLCDLARESGLDAWREKQFRGDKINHTEKRAVLHTALRKPLDQSVMLDGEDVMRKISAMRAQMRDIAQAIRTREWRGISGQPITDVVNIGVGGSDLGPVMAYEALRPYAIHDLKMHFVSNVDESHIADTLEVMKPETTLFIVVSKSFTTQDTLVNARTARHWLTKNSSNPNQVLKHHMLAVTEKQAAAEGFGIPAENILPMWDWVGGRYSLWSAVGLSVAIAVGMEHFEAMLDGAQAMDEHFCTAPYEENIPVIMALLGIWYNNFYNAHTYAVLPYDQYLHRMPPYLRQQDMESNGKTVRRDGTEVDYATGPTIFGQLGILGQHAFYQLMHQGTHIIPADILAPINRRHDIPEHHRLLLSNVFAQTEAF